MPSLSCFFSLNSNFPNEGQHEIWCIFINLVKRAYDGLSNGILFLVLFGLLACLEFLTLRYVEGSDILELLLREVSSAVGVTKTVSTGSFNIHSHDL